MKKMMACLALVASMAVVTLSAQCRYVAPDADEWVEKNRSMLDTLTRAGWLDLDEGYKWYVFSELNPKQQFELWKGKLEQVMNDFEWNEEEMNHLKKIYDWFLEHPDLYEEKSEEQRDKDNEYMEEWAMYALNELKWPKKLIAAISMSCNDLLDKEGNLKTKNQVGVQSIKTDSLSGEK